MVYFCRTRRTSSPAAPRVAEEEGRTNPTPSIPIPSARAGGTVLVLTLASQAGVGGAVSCADDRRTTWMTAGGGEDGHGDTNSNAAPEGTAFGSVFVSLSGL